MSKKQKLVIIGLDGVSWEIINLLIKEGRLPTLKKLINSGVYGVLHSSIPPITAPAWASFVTGKNPGKHGVFDFVQPKESLSNLKPVTSTDIKGATFYEILEKEGKQCILINMPVSYPPRIEGIVITSLMSPDNFIFPQTLVEEIPELKNYRIVPNTSLLTKGKVREYIKDIRKVERTRFTCAKEIFNKKKWDLFFLLFSGTDWVNHSIYSKILKLEDDEEVNEAKALYCDIDSYIKWFINRMDKNTNLIIMSDHGFRVCYGTFFINEWLRRQGYLKVFFRTKKQVYYHRFDEELAKSSKSFSLPSFITKFLLMLTKTLPASTNLLYSVYLILLRHLPFIVMMKAIPQFDKTICYSISSQSRALYINSKKKFNDAPVGDDEYGKIRRKIINELKKLRDSKKYPIMKNVLKGEDVYDGPYLRNAPDIVMIPNDCYMFASYFAPIVFCRKEKLRNDHDENGIFLAYGPDIKKGYCLKISKIIDIAPTILYMFDTPIPKDMDGAILSEIFKIDSNVAKRKPKYVSPKHYEKKKFKEKIKRLARMRCE